MNYKSRKCIFVFIFSLIGTLCLLIALKINSINKKDKLVSEKISYAPNIEINHLVNPKPLNNDSLVSAYILSYFNTHCHFCQHEINDILSNPQLFKNVSITFVSDQPIDTLKKFADALYIDSLAHVTIGQIDYLDFIDKFGEVLPPTTFVYDSNKYLIKKYKGQVLARTIVKDIGNYYQNGVQ